MNKQAITNYIASKLNELVVNSGPQNEIVLLASMLRDITRDDDYAYQSSPLMERTAGYANSQLSASSVYPGAVISAS